MNSNPVPVPAAATTPSAGGRTTSANAASVADLLARIQNTDDAVRGPAWQNAGPVGAPAVVPLGELMTHADFEIARSARRAIERIVRHAGRPGADAEREAVATELARLLRHPAALVRRHALWMLSEIGGRSEVPSMAELLSDPEVREDARCALERIPDRAAIRALRRALRGAPEDFQYALAHSLRVRGVAVEGYPSRKLVPTKPTRVQAG